MIIEVEQLYELMKQKGLIKIKGEFKNGNNKRRIY